MWEGRGKICTCNTLLPKVSQNERVKYVCDYGYEWYVFFMCGMFFMRGMFLLVLIWGKIFAVYVLL